ncbi:MAG: OmpA family protein [Alphaproteobacteria bacterium]|nr:OmpA family protein [Alphaproteobacteria bacterium]MBR2483081.1 OmpA family protein [Alphaproteobacteria bacterium]
MKKYLTIMGLLGLAACGGAPSNIDGDHVFYAFDSAVITDEARESLEDQALYMKKNPEHNVVIEGRCDERGTVEYNLALGALRAGNAAHVLIRNDIEPERIKTISYGKENPIYSGTGEEVWAKNRNATTRVHEVEE